MKVQLVTSSPQLLGQRSSGQTCALHVAHITPIKLAMTVPKSCLSLTDYSTHASTSIFAASGPGSVALIGALPVSGAGETESGAAAAGGEPEPEVGAAARGIGLAVPASSSFPAASAFSFSFWRWVMMCLSHSSTSFLHGADCAPAKEQYSDVRTARSPSQFHRSFACKSGVSWPFEQYAARKHVLAQLC